MKKNTKILVVVIILIILIVVVAIIKINNSKKEEQERIDETITTSVQTEEEKNQLKKILEDNGLYVQIQESVYSEILGEEGNIYSVDGVKFEAYHVNESKINQLSQGNQEEVIIQGENGRKEEGLVFGEFVILKCIDQEMKEKLIEILSEDNEEKTGIIPTSSVNEFSE